MYAKSSAQYFLDGARNSDPLSRQDFTKHIKHRHFAKAIMALLSGYRRPTTVHRDTFAAFQTCVAGTSGDTTLTLSGVDIAVTYATSQTNTAGLLAAAVNASTTALARGGKEFEADNRKATITLTSTAVGTYFDICGVRITAVAKTPNNPSQFEISGNDTADAGTLVVAINTHPLLMDLVCANNSSGVVTVYSRRAATSSRDLAISGSGEVVSAAVLTASTTVCVSSVRKGIPGNHVTTAIAGTGTSIAGTRMTGGATTIETL